MKPLFIAVNTRSYLLILLNLKNWLSKPFDPESLMMRFCQTGSQTDLSRLFNYYGQDLYHYLVSLSNPEIAEDVSQKTWLKVIEKKHLYREQASLKAWLFTIAANTLRDEVRQSSRHISTETAQFDTLLTTCSEPHESILERYNEALMQLPFKQRESFILQQEGFSLAQIAEITSDPQETIKTRLRYAKQHLKFKLGDDHEA
ncbi:hypothetical protein PULV_a1319 [Pseudoalteromonas ulvae UL12]|uniref:RNA polymerase sigma factor n=1 Tax=Pseudoalteromonas ulvae TaxID=107327 RepID=UPI0019FD4AF8|nr:RNA polymerase sigma factor [Pseudoalteromonas ulvae]MBE0363822.1 hypothetical protein [Pseudoalteromonas ulvae UL12]